MLKNVLQEAKHEIENLRRRNDILEAQMRIVDVFGAALFANVSSNQGMSIDIAWSLQKEIDNLANPTIL